MNDNDYLSSVDDYMKLIEWYELRLEFDGGCIYLRDGTPVILLGGIDREKTEEVTASTAMVVIAQATEEEIRELARFVTSLRNKT